MGGAWDTTGTFIGGWASKPREVAPRFLPLRRFDRREPPPEFGSTDAALGAGDWRPRSMLDVRPLDGTLFLFCTKKFL